MGKFYYTYVLKSIKDGNLYVGWTNNLIGRIRKHNKGLINSMKYRRPLNLEYFEACLSKDKAIQREKTLKTGFGRKYIKSRI
jgi:putative endonuclease